MSPDFWLALTAVATLTLAVATAWLGLQTRDVSLKTAALAATSVEEMDLLRQQTIAMREQATASKDELAELREARFAEFLPMLRWQSPSAQLGEEGQSWRLGVAVLLTNEGPGPARIRKVEVTTDTREDFYPEGIDQPSTLPPGERVAFAVRTMKSDVLERRTRVIAIRISYSDLLGEFDYETLIRVEATYAQPVTARFLDSDERSALQRRIPRAD